MRACSNYRGEAVTWGLTPQSGICFIMILVLNEAILLMCKLWFWLGRALLYSEAIYCVYTQYMKAYIVSEVSWKVLSFGPISAAIFTRLGATWQELQSDVRLLAASAGVGGSWESVN